MLTQTTGQTALNEQGICTALRTLHHGYVVLLEQPLSSYQGLTVADSDPAVRLTVLHVLECQRKALNVLITAIKKGHWNFTINERGEEVRNDSANEGR